LAALTDEPRRRALPLAAAAAFVLAAATLALVATRSRTRAAEPSSLFPHAGQVTTSTRLDAWPAFMPDGASLVFASERSGSFELYQLPLAPGGREIAITSDGRQNLHPAISPDGRSVAYSCRLRGGIWIVPAEGGTPRPLTDFGSRPAFSPDGSLLAFQSETPPSAGGTDFGSMPPSAIWLLSMKDGALRRLTRPGDPPGGHGSPAFSPDGKWIVFSASDPETTRLWAVPVAGGKAVPLDAGTTYEFDPAVAADGTLYFGAVTGEWRCTIRRVKVDWSVARLQGAASVVTDTGAIIPRHIVISHDGTKLAYSAESLRSNLMSIAVTPSGEAAGPPTALTSESARNSRPVYSPNGRKLAFTRWRPGVNIDVWVMDADGRNAEQLTTDPSEDSVPSWFPKGDRIAYLSTRLGPATLFSKPTKGGMAQKLLDLGSDFDSPRLSPDGTRVAFNSKRGGGTINVWMAELASGTVRQVTFDRELAGFPSWSPDGKLLAVQVRRGDDRQVGIVPVEGGKIELLTEAHGQSWGDSFSPDGQRIVFAGNRDGLWNIYWVSRGTKEERQLTVQTSPNVYVRYPSWSPNGDRIAFEWAETFGNVWVLSR
jgi:Tol biopolymer transport system component